MRVFALQSVMLLCLVGSVIGQSDQSPWPFSRQPWNVKGDVLILDVGSLKYQGYYRTTPLLGENDCDDACARTPGCDAWAYCSSKQGCGSGCAAHVASNPPLRSARPVSEFGPNGDPSLPDPAWSNLSTITSFGPWGVTANCQFTCDNPGPCKHGDAWPYGVCTLKKLPNPDKPEFWSTDAGEGWVSGFTKQPPECAGMPVLTCARCLRSKDPSSCLKCASTPSFRVGPLEGTQTLRPNKADGCSTCFDSSAPEECVECLTSDAPCGECALMYPDPPLVFDVPACINCTKQHGGTFTVACRQCSFLGAQPQRVHQCMHCLEALAPGACNSTYFAPGWANACAACASLDTGFDTCLACMESSPFRNDCEACASLSEVAKRDACYECARSAADVGSGCYECLSSPFDGPQMQQCVECVTSPKTPSHSKGMCYNCQNWCSTFDTRAKCVACLALPQDDYLMACGCNT